MGLSVIFLLFPWRKKRAEVFVVVLVHPLIIIGERAVVKKGNNVVAFIIVIDDCVFWKIDWCHQLMQTDMLCADTFKTNPHSNHFQINYRCDNFNSATALLLFFYITLFSLFLFSILFIPFSINKVSLTSQKIDNDISNGKNFFDLSILGMAEARVLL